MEIDTYYLHVTVFLVAVVFFYIRYIAAQRDCASFKMYKVRDEFVYLVASEVIRENDPVFSYYYKRINSVLAMAPNVGVDDLLHALFNDSANVEKALERSRKHVERILSSDSAQKEEVKQVIESYYLGIRHMMLSHSSVLRIILILTKKFNPLRRLFEKITPKNNPIRGAYKFTEYAEREANNLHNGCPC